MVYFVAVIAMMALGLLTLALQKLDHGFWVRNKSRLSLLVNTLGALLFIISSQPYAAAFAFLFLVIKAAMLLKWQ